MIAPSLSRSSLALAAAVLVLAACAEPPRPASRGPFGGGAAAPRPNERDETRAAADAVNRNRGSCAPLAWDDAAARAAQAHSDDMARRQYFSHQSPEGRAVGDRLAAQGVAYSAVAENLGVGYTSGEATVRGWMGSPGHRRNIQWCDVTRMGIGVRDTYWTLVLYTPRG